jgi:guanine deaminase
MTGPIVAAGMKDVGPEQRWLALAIQLATANVEVSGGGPFASIIVRDGEIIGRGVNRVTRDLDPTAHADIVAIRSACRHTLSFHLAGAVLFCSCEPCPMCLCASLWAHIDRVVYAADHYDAAAGGFVDPRYQEVFDQPQSEWPMQVVQLSMDDRMAPFRAWLAKPDRVAY